MQMALHHVKDLRKALKAFRSLLKKGGFLCVADLDKEDGSFHGPGFDGHNGFERESLKKLAEAAGFEEAFFETAMTMEKPVDGGALRSFPIFLMTAKAS